MLFAFSPQAGAALSIEPITWGVVGLDSNNVNVGPNNFPVGARVCSQAGDGASTADVSFAFNTANAFINLRPGTLSTIDDLAIPDGGCADAYFEVTVTRNAAAYETSREYTITAVSNNGLGTVSTPSPRELYVEFLISQSRNSVTDILLDGQSVSVGGSMTLVVGQTYDITLADRHLTVVLNGAMIHDNVPLLGCTGGALWSDEFKPGPIYLQGDHTGVEYRNMVLTPIVR